MLEMLFVEHRLPVTRPRATTKLTEWQEGMEMKRSGFSKIINEEGR